MVGGWSALVAPLRGADLYLDHHPPLPVHQIGGEEGIEPQDGGCGVTAHPAGIAGAGQIRTMQLWQAVDEASEPLRGGVLLAVPLPVEGRVAQTEVGREVNEAWGQISKLGDVLLGHPMRQSQEKQVAWLQIGQSHELEARLSPQVGMHKVDVASSAAFRGHLSHLDVGVSQQQPQHLPAYVSGAADDRSFKRT